ncbi:MAG: nucleotidyltransferase family protein [Sulfurimonas sp.]|uniref:nucleotidyltransferase family protein n=1 Tax=Sulfurimonas sp. TaxID=2022749 RepID=UPI00261133E8|nr:nucleotidyltransferase family protein [Sulfurimonas sp.]MDD5372763.1 nucleotidyltransferase family protein [Sulfurimonas sp.]
MEVIILAGGFGTRLQSVVKDVPKPMADINKKPFLEYLLQYLSKYDITNIVISVGYKQDVIKAYFKSEYKGIPLSYSCEDEPLGTGGAIKKALSLITDNAKNVLVINGDTFFEVDLAELEKTNNKFEADITISLKEMRNFDRYGAVKVESGIVKKFEEKKFYHKAYINGGVYMIKKSIFDKLPTLSKFSFEEFLENNLSNMKVCSYVSNNSYFIDIGIPSDYEKAKTDFQNKPFF